MLFPFNFFPVLFKRQRQRI